jgi:hypothetical protein
MFQLMQQVFLLFGVADYGNLFDAILEQLFQLLFRLLRFSLRFYKLTLEGLNSCFQLLNIRVRLDVACVGSVVFNLMYHTKWSNDRVFLDKDSRV